MNILLVKAGVASGDHIQPPLGLAYLASELRAQGHEARILDFPKIGRSDPAFLSLLKDFSPMLVGFQCYTSEISEVKRMAAIVRQVLPAAVIVAGGPHPTLCPEESFAKLSPNLDYILMGEGEESLPLLAAALRDKSALDEIPGLAFKSGASLKLNPMKFIQDLDALPLPAWDLIKPQEYPPSQHGAFYKQFPIAPIVTTRGCPFSCGFCTAPILSGKRMRTRSADSVMKEIELLYRDFGIREIHIIDDNFTLDKRHAVAILRKISESGLPISLSFPNGVRINTLDEELLDLMKESGAYFISVGIESGSNKVLKNMNKALTVERVREKVKLIREKGIDIAAFFVIGFPDETVEDIEQTISFALELPLLRANFFTFLPLPMTPITQKLKENGELGDMDVSDLIFQNVPYAPKGITKEELKRLQRKAFMKFYLRPGVFFGNISQIRSPLHLYYLAKRFYHWMVM